MVIAFLRESPLFGSKYTECGKYNGYVGFKEELPLSYQGQYDQNVEINDDNYDYLDNYISVHGGITFDNKFKEDYPIIPLTDIPKDWHTYRIIGFDCAHFNDTPEEWTFEETKEETLDLKEQIEKLIKTYNK